jgi:hypothetical protein
VDSQTRNLVDTAQAYDLAESQRLRRAVLASEAGLNPGEFARPFPGNQVTITHNHSPALPAGDSMLKKLLPYFASGLLGAAGTAGLLAFRGGSSAPPLPTPGPQPAQVKPIDLRVKWWVENGQVKTQVEPAP